MGSDDLVYGAQRSLLLNATLMFTAVWPDGPKFDNLGWMERVKRANAQVSRTKNLPKPVKLSQLCVLNS
jgi:hypothetical protein